MSTNLFRREWRKMIDSCPWIDFRRKMVYDCPVCKKNRSSSVQDISICYETRRRIGKICASQVGGFGFMAVWIQIIQRAKQLSRQIHVTEEKRGKKCVSASILILFHFWLDEKLLRCLSQSLALVMSNEASYVIHSNEIRSTTQKVRCRTIYSVNIRIRYEYSWIILLTNSPDIH